MREGRILLEAGEGPFFAGVYDLFCNDGFARVYGNEAYQPPALVSKGVSATFIANLRKVAGGERTPNHSSHEMLSGISRDDAAAYLEKLGLARLNETEN